MRSRSNSMEDLAQAKPSAQRQQQQQQHEQQQRARSRRRAAEHEEPSGRDPGQPRHREPPDDAATIQRNHKSGSGSGSSSSGHSSSGHRGSGHHRVRAASAGKGRDLSRDDLLFLLSMLEGELQVG